MFSAPSNLNSSTREQMSLPMEGLVALLRAYGFIIKPDCYIAMLQLVAQAGNEDASILKYKLCPLVSTTEEEQLRFYKVFNEYMVQTNQDCNSEKVLKKVPLKSFWWYFLAWGVLVSWLLFIIYHHKGIKTFQASFDISSIGKNAWEQISLADTLLFDASKSFPDGLDTSTATIYWDTGNGWKHRNEKSIIIPAKKGPISCKVVSGLNQKCISITSRDLDICEGVVKMFGTPGGTYNVGVTVSLSILQRGNVDSSVIISWLVNGDTIKRNSNSLRYTLMQPGYYKIRAVLNKAYCELFLTKDYFVKDVAGGINMTALQTGSKLNFDKSSVPWWMMACLALVPFLVGFLLYLLSRFIIRLGGGIDSQASYNKSKLVSPPYDVPMENRDIKQVSREDSMNTIFTAMRRKVDDGQLVLNISQSIKKVIQSGGAPAIVYANKQEQQHYLILVDKANSKSQELQLFNYLVRLLDEENIWMDVFFYQSFDIFNNREYPQGVSYIHLAEKYRNSVLIIFGSGHQLLMPGSPMLAPEKWIYLNDWQYKAILTPIPFKDWGVREDAIKQNIMLFPADIEGQLRMMQVLRENQLGNDTYMKSVQGWYETGEFLQFTEIEELKKYLSDDDLFQWVCAISVYPVIRWEVIIHIGQTHFNSVNSPQKLNYSNLLKLVRIKWLRMGVFPELTRLELLKELLVENELVARRTICMMLHYSNLFSDGTRFFEAEKDLQKLTNEFVLYTSGEYPQFKDSAEQFRDVYEEKRIMDVVMLHYLEKLEGDYETPIKFQGVNTSIRQYFSLEDKKNKILKLKKWKMWGPLLLGVFCLNIIGILIGEKWIYTKLSARSWWPEVVENRSVRVNIFLHTADTCELLQKIFNRPLFYNLEGFGKHWIKPVKRNDSASFFIDKKLLKEVTSVTILNDDGLLLVTAPLNIEKENIYLNIDGLCAPQSSKKINVLIKYNNLSLLPIVLKMKQSFSEQFEVDAVLANFKDSSLQFNPNNINSSLVRSVERIVNQYYNKKLPNNGTLKENTADVIISLSDSAFVPPASISVKDLPSDIDRIWESNSHGDLLRVSLKQNVVLMKMEGGNLNTYSITSVKSIGKGYQLALFNGLYNSIRLIVDSSGNLNVNYYTIFDSNGEMINKNSPVWVNYKERKRVGKYSNDSMLVLRVTPHELKMVNSENEENKIIPSDIKQFGEELELTLYTSDLDGDNQLYGVLLNYNNLLTSLKNAGISYSSKHTVVPMSVVPDYIVITAKKNFADCSRTIYSLEDAEKMGNPFQICKLDLSNSSRKIWPKELFKYKNLRKLILNEDYLTNEERIYLKNNLQNCVIQYVSKQPEYSIGYIHVDDFGNPDQNGKQMIKSIANILKLHPDCRIKMVGTSFNQMNSKTVSRNMKILRTLFHRAGSPSDPDPIDQAIYLVADQLPAKVKGGVVDSKRKGESNVITIIGLTRRELFSVRN